MLLSVTVGLATGIVASATVWYLLLHRAGPKLEWRADLEPYDTADGQRRAVEVCNLRGRPAVDLDIRVRLVLPDLVRAGNPEVWTILKRDRPFIDAGESVRYAVRPEWISDQTLDQYRNYLPDGLAERIEAKDSVDLLEIAGLVPGCALELVALATDVGSGSRGICRMVVQLDRVLG